jgi:CHAD domain-containing protein
MAAALRPRKSAAKAVRRAICSESEAALEHLTSVWPPSDQEIHEARKRIKRARAELRLLRDGLGESVYQRENATLRDAARPLSEVRDAKILVGALDELARKHPQLDRKAIERLRSELLASRLRARRRALSHPDTLEPTREALRATIRRLPKPRGSQGWAALRSGLRRVYRSGRRAAEAAEQRPTDETLHETRKQAKYLWHELEILEPIEAAKVAKLARLAHQISDRLGDDHDLAILRQKVLSSRSLSRASIRSMLAAIDRGRRKRQRQARRLARRLYRERPRAFEKRIRSYWRAWRRRYA